jgi:hypothetical protein
MKLKIEIKMDNAAFEADGETRRFRNADEPARILRKLAHGWQGGTLEVGEIENLHDINGNHVGQARIAR